MKNELSFRRMAADDLPLMHAWLQREHVREWWDEPWPYDDVVDQYLPAIQGDKPTDLYLVLLGECPVGFVQTYLVADHPDYAALVDVGEGVAGLDLFLADAELLGRGLGTQAIRRFLAAVVFARPETTACIADPDVRNVRSIRAFEKAGFRVVRQFFDPTDGQTHALVRLDR